MKKNLRFYIALWVSKTMIVLMRLLGRNASYLPGKFALKICPDFLGRCSKPDKIITVTGTNGKTTCCNMILDVLEDNGVKVLNNKAGSNTDAGIASAFAGAATLGGKVRESVALLEVDERSSLRIYPYIHPTYTVCTNLFRDSIQRNAHTEFIFSIIDKALPDDTYMILNADDPVSCRLKANNKRSYFSIARLPSDRNECVNIINDARVCPNCGRIPEYEYVRYHHIGKMHCPNCGLSSPEADFVAVPDFENNSFTVTVNGTRETYPTINESVFNIYNQLTTVTLLRTFGLSADSIAKSFSHMSIIKSRYSKSERKGIEVVTNMAKRQNPVASSIVFDFMRSEPGNKEVILMLDAPEYRKTTENMTWIYDADYELLNDDSIKRVVAAGIRVHDYHLRLLLAGIPEEKLRCVANELDAAHELELCDTDKVFILHDMTTMPLTEKVKAAVLDEIEKRGAERA